MARLIDADALKTSILELAKTPARCCGKTELIAERNLAICDAMETVNAAPTVEVPKWIPMEERIPEEGTPVLVYGKGGDDGFAIQTQWDGNWTVEWGGVWYPTHWMPLPEPPEVTSHGNHD